MNHFYSSFNEKSRPETGRHSKQKVYQAWMEPAFESSRRQCHNNPARSISISANRHIGWSELARRQPLDELRNERYRNAQQPNHASRMAFRRYCLLLHLISVRTDVVRPECYYILYLKAS